MSLSTASTFNPVLSEALNKIGLNRFVGTRILPVHTVGTKKGQYPVIGAEQFDNDYSKSRAPGTKSARKDGVYSQADYKVAQYMLEHAFPDEDETQANDDGFMDAKASYALNLQRDLMVGHELRVEAALYAASFNSTNATATMTTVASAKPIIDIQNAVERLNANGFFENLALIIESSLFNAMINTDEVRKIFNGAAVYTNRQVILDALGVSEIIVCPTRYNTAKKGQSASRGKVWPATKYLVAQVAGGSFANGGIGRTLAYAPDGGIFTAEEYREETEKQDVLRVFNSVAEEIINVNAGELIANAG